MQRIQKRVFTSLLMAAVAAAIVFGLLAVVSDGRAMADAVRGFPILALASMLVLSLVGFIVRGLRWRYLSGVAGENPDVSDALFVQFSSLTMSVTPAKLGELMKAYINHQVTGLPTERGIVLVFAERVADVLGVAILSLLGLHLLRGTLAALLAIALLVVIALVAARSPRLQERLLAFVERRAKAERATAIRSLSTLIRDVLAPRRLIVNVMLGSLAWGLEGVGLVICLRALGSSLPSAPETIAAYAAATILGALTFLPGGVGLTEFSLAGLLVLGGVDPSTATAATLIIRIATLWFGVGVGWIAVATRPSVIRQAFAHSFGD